MGLMIKPGLHAIHKHAICRYAMDLFGGMRHVLVQRLQEMRQSARALYK